jgi:hypothetical protein
MNNCQRMANLTKKCQNLFGLIALAEKVFPVPCYTPWCEDLSPSCSLAERGQPHLPPCYLPPSPVQMGLQDGRRTQQRHNTPPPASAPPPSRGTCSCWLGPRCRVPHPPPYLPLHRSRWQAEQGGWDPATAQQTTCRPLLSSVAPSWASVVRDGTCASSPHTSTPPREDFFRLMNSVSPAGFNPASQYVTPLVIRRYRSLVTFNHHLSSLPCHFSNAAVVGAAAIASGRDQ